MHRRMSPRKKMVVVVRSKVKYPCQARQLQAWEGLRWRDGQHGDRTNYTPSLLLADLFLVLPLYI
jgi:hypothetical protein